MRKASWPARGRRCDQFSQTPGVGELGGSPRRGPGKGRRGRITSPECGDEDADGQARLGGLQMEPGFSGKHGGGCGHHLLHVP